MAKRSTVDVPPRVHVSINACGQVVQLHGIDRWGPERLYSRGGGGGPVRAAMKP